MRIPTGAYEVDSEWYEDDDGPPRRFFTGSTRLVRDAAVVISGWQYGDGRVEPLLYLSDEPGKDDGLADFTPDDARHLAAALPADEAEAIRRPSPAWFAA